MNDENLGAGPVMNGRVPTKYRDKIEELARELARQKDGKHDFVLSTEKIEAKSTMMPVAPKSTKDLVLNFDRKEGLETFPLTEYAHGQLATKCGIPERYYWAMLDAGMAELTAENVNAWLSKKAETRFIRTLDGKVRAILSDKYRPLDNYDLAFAVMDRAKEHGAKVQECELTERRMYIKIVVPEMQEQLDLDMFQGYQPGTHDRVGYVDGDPIIPGLIVSNSEVGAGAFRVEPFLWRLVCQNGLIGMDSLYKIHLGQKLEIGEVNIFKTDTLQAQDDALWKQVRDIIDSTFEPKVLKALVEKLRGTRGIKVDVDRDIDATVKNLSLSDKHRDDLLRYFGKESEDLFGLINGVTRLAQDFENYDTRVDIERYAGKMLELEAVPTAR